MATAIGTARMKKINHCFCLSIEKGDEALTTGLKTSSEGLDEATEGSLEGVEGVVGAKESVDDWELDCVVGLSVLIGDEFQ